ncbi:MAG: TIGR02281 family clan AA aspartic protease [Pseudomonadota bacterium]
MSDSGQRNLGKGMILVGWLCLLGVLTLFFSDRLDQRYNPNQNLSGQQLEDGSRVVELKSSRGGHYVASGSINGVTANFLLDTGATTVSVPEHIARTMGLERGAPIMMSTANGTATAYMTTLDSVRLGNIELNGVRATINPNTEFDEILLGMSFLRHLEFTQRGDTLKLRQY